jgi:CRISPR-associated endonuclease/helicase Cas3
MKFRDTFQSLTGNAPFPWQEALYERFISDRSDGIPKSCSIPTGLGKTSVVAIWLLAFSQRPDLMPRRLVYVVNRRTVVDQTTEEMVRYRYAISNNSSLSSLKPLFDPLPISTLRGQFADNGEWCEDPSRPAIVCGTVDMIGSRLLFSGYRIGYKTRPLHAGFLAQDSLLVHDESHLEPAFQRIIEQIQAEQLSEPSIPWPKFQVMELTATSKSVASFQLDSTSLIDVKNDYANPVVSQRMNATKILHLHPLRDEKKPQLELTLKAKEFAKSSAAVLVFASSVESVLDIATALAKARLPVKTLTGTMRGEERDKLVTDKTFARFLPNAPDDKTQADTTQGTAYLICTSAGEVGINISADHLVCDLSTYESVAQRFGRVNRFGASHNSEIHLFYPEQWDETNPLTEPRKKTLELLRLLNGNASPQALVDLPADQRCAAFSPSPETLPATSILFDAWSMTTIRCKLPGRPNVEPWLHGIVDFEPPQTKFAWRKEVERLSDTAISSEIREELLEAYPLLQKELLTEPSYRAFKHLQKIANKHPDASAWIIDDFGSVEVVTLSTLADKNNKGRIERNTIVLGPAVGGLSESGMLDSNSDIASDVSETDRCRWRDDDEAIVGMHEVFSFAFPAEDEDNEVEVLRWFTRRNTGEAKSRKPVLLDVHVSDVENRMSGILGRMSLGERFNQCLMLAAKYHDHGKARHVFQAKLGNRPGSEILWAKSGQKNASMIIENYRHEFGSLHDLPSSKVLKVSDEEHDLIKHLIAAHHGRARPHFPRDEVFDPNATPEDDEALALSVAQRFGRLQRRYGRWGLAFLESLLRAADWSASANPSSELEGNS